MIRIKCEKARRARISASSLLWEGDMKPKVSRAVAQRATYQQEDFVALWSTAMWIGGAIYLLATLHVF